MSIIMPYKAKADSKAAVTLPTNVNTTERTCVVKGQMSQC